MGTRYRGKPAEVRALDAYITLMRCAVSVGSRLERPLARRGLTENQFGVLETLLHLGPLPQYELGAKLFTSRPNVTLVVKQLEARGLVERRRSGEDARCVIVSLTPAAPQAEAAPAFRPCDRSCALHARVVPACRRRDARFCDSQA